MKHLFTLLLLCVCCMAGRFANAQDLMYLKNVKKPFQVKIYDIGLDEIKYKPWGDTAMPMLAIARIRINKLVMQNGSVFDLKKADFVDPISYAYQHNNAIKFSFLSPFYSNLAFSYERSIKQGRSFEVGLSIIGIGIKNYFYPRGMYMRLGYKFITLPDFYAREKKYAHILKGSYIKPEIAFGEYSISRGYTYRTAYRCNATFGGVMVNFGKQWVMNDAFVFDMFFGVGFGFVKFEEEPHPSSNSVEEPRVYQYAFVGGIKEFPMALTGGLKIGYVFGKQREKPRLGKPK